MTSPSKPRHKKSPEVLDELWGAFSATGERLPVVGVPNMGAWAATTEDDPCVGTPCGAEPGCGGEPAAECRGHDISGRITSVTSNTAATGRKVFMPHVSQRPAHRLGCGGDTEGWECGRAPPLTASSTR